jgi:hypothetical protein
MQNMKIKSTDAPADRSTSQWLPLLLIVAVILVWVAGGWFARTQTDPGVFGDMFGAVNALFSGLAFAGVIYAILLQRKELELQREELRQTRDELHAQTKHLAEQNATLSEQAANSTFFELLRLHNEIVGAIDLVNKQQGTTIARGRDCFYVFYRTLRAKYSEQKEKNPNRSDLDRIQAGYKVFYSEHQADIGHYFRSIYNLVKFVDRSKFEDKRVYSNLIRAQLSSYEVALLFYNCLSELGSEKFKPLVERYAMLKHLPREALFHEDRAAMHYSPGAFS